MDRMKERKNLEVEHWKCASCKVDITRNNEDEVFCDTHFDISRSKKELILEGYSIEEELDVRNEKMSYILCESCFLKVCQESPTLGKLFFVKKGALGGGMPEEDTFIY